MIEAMQRFQIERREKLSRDSFHQEFLSGAGKPVIVTDAMEGWPALSKWSFDFFKTQYGADTVVVRPGLDSKATRVMKLADYIDYVESPEGIAGGFWIDLATGLPLSEPPEHPTLPLYLYLWNPVVEHPELLEDVEVTPYFVEDWMRLLTPSTRELLRWANKPYYWVLVGPEGACARLHQDFGGTHAYLAQVAGRKKCILFSPAESELIYHGKIDPEQPDFTRFPLLRKARLFEGILEPGEMLFMPAGWWHYVRVLEKSITFSYDFFNRENFGLYFEEFIKGLPGTLGAFEKSPELRATMGIKWMCRGFEPAESKTGRKKEK